MSFLVKIAILRLTQMKWINSELLRKHLVVLTCYTTAQKPPNRFIQIILQFRLLLIEWRCHAGLTTEAT